MIKKTRNTNSSSLQKTTGAVSRTAQKNAEKARENAKKKSEQNKKAFKKTTKKTSVQGTKKTTLKYASKKITKKATKKATKKHGKKRGGRRQMVQTNAERIVSSTNSNGDGREFKIPKVEKETLRIIPIGGQEEVGRNMTVFEYGKDIVIVDMGMQFPEEDMPGIDYIVPNINYLKGKEQNIRGVIFTHGHLDHIGAASVLLKELGYPPVIARDLTLALIKKKLEDGNPGGSDKIRTISVKNIDRKIRLGAFMANFFEVEHSIMDSMGVALVTPVGTPIHLGDWMISNDPADGSVISYEKLKDFPEPRILMLESLGVMSSESKSEKEVQGNIETLIRDAKGRIVIATFSSQIKRIKLLLQYASKLGKRVALDGYSMRTNVEVAQNLGYLDVAKDLLIPINDIEKYPDNKVIVLCTGAQGEHNAVLNRIVTDNHRFIKIKKSDTIVFSSSVIPGNERSVQRLKDNLYRKCDNVVHSSIMADIHTSGHATKQDIQKMIKMVQPQYFIPIYANYFMLKEASKLAIADGFPPKRIAILDNGSIIEFRKTGVKIRKEKADSSYVFVDGLGVGDIGHVVLRDRQMLAEDGMYVITVLIDSKTKQVVGNMQITSRGFIYVKDNFDLINDTKRKVRDVIKKTTSTDSKMDYRQVETDIRDRVGEFLFQKTQRRPMVLPVVIEV
ncbi:MAG: ribonuclease J [Candidatus Moraniibacteriota bacterium]|jgi:ribonuclease J